MRLFQLLLSHVWLALVQATINSTTINGLSYGRGNGDIRFHFDDAVVNGCSSVIMMGVGTSMSVEQYDKLAREIVQGKPIVFIMADTNPCYWKNAVKYCPAPDPLKNCHEKDYANFTELIAKQLTTMIHVCQGHQKKPRFFIGGHSASGQSALGALGYLKFQPDGFIGLDPAEIDLEIFKIPLRVCPFNFANGYQKLPVTLNIGFEREPCLVHPKESAAYAYEESDAASRVFIRIKTPPFTSIIHCSFADQGCPLCPTPLWCIFCPLPWWCPVRPSWDWNEDQANLVRQVVTKAIHILVEGSVPANPADYQDLSVIGLNFNVAVNNDSVSCQSTTRAGT